MGSRPWPNSTLSPVKFNFVMECGYSRELGKGACKLPGSGPTTVRLLEYKSQPWLDLSFFFWKVGGLDDTFFLFEVYFPYLSWLSSRFSFGELGLQVILCDWLRYLYCSTGISGRDTVGRALSLSYHLIATQLGRKWAVFGCVHGTECVMGQQKHLKERMLGG